MKNEVGLLLENWGGSIREKKTPQVGPIPEN